VVGVTEVKEPIIKRPQKIHPFRFPEPALLLFVEWCAGNIKLLIKFSSRIQETAIFRKIITILTGKK
jgi:hypothetical protein